MSFIFVGVDAADLRSNSFPLFSPMISFLNAFFVLGMYVRNVHNV